MATERISWTSGAPTTEFLLYADRVGQSVSGNYTTVRIYIRAYNRGSTSSYFGDSGYHHGWIAGWGDQDLVQNPTPFLPSGYATGAQRWSKSRDIQIPHNSDGTRGAVTLRMTVGMGSQSTDKSVSFDDFPDIDVSTVPAEPTIKPAYNVTRSGVTIDLDTNGDGGAAITQAQIRYSQNTDASGAQTSTGLPSYYIFDIGGLPRFRTYYFWGRMYNKNGWSTYTDRVQATTLADQPAILTPLGLDNITQTGVHYWFRANDDGCDAGWAEFQVGYGTDPNGPQAYMNPGGGDAWIGGLVRNTHYYIWVRGRSNANIWSDWSGRNEFQTLAYIPTPPKPRYIDNVTQNQLHFVFDYMNDDGGAGILEWQIAYGTDPNQASTYISVAGGDNWIGGLTPGTTYYFWVRARNQQGWSDWGINFSSNNQRASARTASGGRVKIAGVWREVIPLVKADGAWKLAQPYVKDQGAWRRSV